MRMVTEVALAMVRLLGLAVAVPPSVLSWSMEAKYMPSPGASERVTGCSPWGWPAPATWAAALPVSWTRLWGRAVTDFWSGLSRVRVALSWWGLLAVTRRTMA